MTKKVTNRFKELLAIKERKENRAYSRREIAEITGISLTSIQNWVHNRVSQYQDGQIIAFCEFFDCSLSDLILIEEVAEEGIEETLLATA